ncbi:MAG: type II toxin-antitoxin system VapC family toxin [Nitrospira sp. SB0675_bin_23]|nr:type II toxin-antitoxin system VapC family toxin [Nitrospira sp. SB0661_bin_20]MYH01181.1 type II toxin-antitoxin system VapC family toxin [Nitrospira sp. SB0675_bin_23]MYJ22771.1 type II toxin-antitoxin system VapC family toxin [Nitrospira sp. SB0673_bin_12]
MQRLLLDTHVFIWCLSDVLKLAKGACTAITDPRNTIFVSAVTGWELSIKRAKGRMTAPDNLIGMIEDKGFTHLPLTFDHAEHAGNLPMYHRDPFDRFLVAQAQVEGLTLVTRDAYIPRYGIRTMPA